MIAREEEFRNIAELVSGLIGRNWRPHSPWWGPPELHGLIPHIRIMAVTGAQRGMNHVVTKNSFISNVRTKQKNINKGNSVCVLKGQRNSPHHTWTSLPRLRYSRWKVRTHIHMRLLPLLRDSDREGASCRIRFPSSSTRSIVVL